MAVKPLNSLEKQEIEIDGAKKPLGRLSVEIAKYLQGKHRRDYDPAKDYPIEVVVKNADKIVFTGKKLQQNVVYKHTGYIGHLKEYKLKDLWQRQPLRIIQKAVSGMLPKNKLRQRRIKRIRLAK